MLEDTCGGLLGRHRARLHVSGGKHAGHGPRGAAAALSSASAHRKGLVGVDQDAEVFVSECRTSVFQRLSWFCKLLHLR